MRYKTVKDVVEHSRSLHHQISEFYHKLGEQSSQVRVKMLLEYLERHEAQFEEMLQKFESDKSQKIWDEWFQYAPEHNLEEILTEIDVKEDMNVDDVVAMALKLDDYFIDLYKDMSQNAASSDVKAVFENLVAMEEKEKIRTARTAIEMNDM